MRDTSPPRNLVCMLLMLSTLTLAFGRGTFAADSGNWLGFRGDSTGAADRGPEKLSMNEGSDTGTLAWRLDMPGRSVAGPIVVGDLVVSTSSAGQDGEQMFVTGVDLATGAVRWEQSFRATGRPFCHPTSANAAPSPVSDGERIFAFFSSNDLACLSLEGDLIWYRGLGYDFPKAGNDLGMASSPVIANGAVIAQVEAQGDSFAIGLDVETGETLWRIPRPQSSNWASPVKIERPDGATEVVLQAGSYVVAVEPRTGNESWRIDEGRATTPSPTAAGDILLLPGDDLLAVDVGGSATSPETAWRNNKLAPRNASTVVGNDRVYALKGSVLVAGDLESGDTIWQERLSGLSGTWATPVVAGERLYVFDQSGKGMLIEDRGDSAEVVSEVDLGEPVLASPAVVDGRLIVRSAKTLFCFR